MSDYHVRVQGLEYKTVNVVFHIPVPAGGKNQANLSWRDAVVNEQGGSSKIESVLPDLIGTQEETNLKAGAIIEKVETVRFSTKNLTPTERLIEVETRFNEIKTEFINDKQITLQWIGFEGNV